jgi:hypothetical protein
MGGLLLLKVSPPMGYHETLPLLLPRAYGKRPWTPQSITRAHHALPLYALWAATPETSVEYGWVAACKAGVPRPSSTTMNTP